MAVTHVEQLLILPTVGEKCGRAAYEAAMRADATTMPWLDLDAKERARWIDVALATVFRYAAEVAADDACQKMMACASQFGRDDGDAPPG